MTPDVMLVIAAFLVLVLLIAIVIFFWSGRTANAAYGPERHLDGPPQIRGALVCESWKAPTLGKKLQFAYEIKGRVGDGALTATYRYPATGRQKYEGDVMLSQGQGEVRGRAEMGMVGNMAVEGELSAAEADLRLGFPQGSVLRFLNAPFRFRVEGNGVRFLDTDNGQGAIKHTSRLTVTDNRVSGRLAHSRESWIVAIDVAYQDAEPALVVLVILLAANNILRFHHD